MRGGVRRVAALILAVVSTASVMVATPPLQADAIGPNECPWPTHLDANTTNVAFPDQNANYYTLGISSLGIESLTIKGKFPHARYMSFTTYTGQTQASWSVAGNSQYVVYGGEFPSVNGMQQQGLVRFAVPALAPNKVGPENNAQLEPVVAPPLPSTASHLFGSLLSNLELRTGEAGRRVREAMRNADAIARHAYLRAADSPGATIGSAERA